MIVNGVTLPDIPADVLAQYPYAVITSVTMSMPSIDFTMVMYRLMVADVPFDLLPKELIQTDGDYYGSKGTGYTLTCVPDEEFEWANDNAEPAEMPMAPAGGDMIQGNANYHFAFVWTNQEEVKTAVWIDFETGEWGTEPREDGGERPDRVSIACSLMDGFAVEAQRLTGTTAQMNAVQMRGLLASANSSGTGEEDLSEVELGTSRVSIGYELFDDIVNQVQRLTGTTEQMNAITAYRKLKSVVASFSKDILLPNGIPLPGVPADDWAKCKYWVVFCTIADAGVYDPSYTGYSAYRLVGSTEGLAYAPADVSLYDNPTIQAVVGSTYSVTFDIMIGPDGTIAQRERSVMDNWGCSEVPGDIMWSNHNVMLMTGTPPTVSNQVYFAATEPDYSP